MRHFTPSLAPEQPARSYATFDREMLRRLSVVSWAVVAAMVVSLFLRLPTIVFSLEVLGSPFTLSLQDSTLMAAFVAVLAASGTHSVLRSHPLISRPSAQDGGGRDLWVYLSLPAALSILSVLLIPLAPSRLFQVLIILVGGGLITMAIIALYRTVWSGGSGFRSARLLLNVLAYGAALLLFLLVYQTRTRSLLSGTLVAATATLLAVELLRTATPRTSLVLSYAAIVGIILGEVTWALNYWVLPGLSGGLSLLLIFYLSVGIAQHGLQNRLTRRVIIEFVVFGALALLLIAVVGPGV
jgi:hypothetical protein